jgi:putative permease
MDNMNKFLSSCFNRYFSHPEAIVLMAISIVTVIVIMAIGNVLVPIVISIILAYLLSFMVEKLKKWRCPHLLAVSLVFLFFMGLFLLLLLYLLPLLWEQMANLIFEVPASLSRWEASLFGLQQYFPEVISNNQIYQFIKYIENCFITFSKELVGFSLSSLFGIVTVIVYFILVPLLIFFFLRDGKNIINWLVGFLPKKRNTLEIIWLEAYRKVSRYILGRSIEIILVGTVTIAAFELLQMHYAVLLGALVGLSVIIPYVGTVVVTTPIIIVGLNQWGWGEHFFYMALVYTIIIVLDANVLVPLLFAEVMELHPLAIILSVLIFGSLFGFWGVFFAIPLMALINVIFKLWPKETKEI